MSYLHGPGERLAALYACGWRPSLGRTVLLLGDAHEWCPRRLGAQVRSFRRWPA